jgi:hypothetical protein
MKALYTADPTALTRGHCIDYHYVDGHDAHVKAAQLEHAQAYCTGEPHLFLSLS